MNPFFILALGAGVVYLTKVLRTAKAAKNLRYSLSRIQIYKLNLSEPIIIRVWVSFTNLENAPIVVKQLYLDIYLQANDAKMKIGTLNTDGISIVIPKNSTVERSFDISVPWKNLGITALNFLTTYLNRRNSGFPLPNKAIVEGQLKIVGLTIPINEEVSFSNAD